MPMQGPSNGDIRAMLALSQEEARNGSSRVLNLPGGRHLVVPVHPGVLDGEEIRLPGEGEPAWEGGPAGDLILTVTVVPTRQTGTRDYAMGRPTEFAPATSWQPTGNSLESPAYPGTISSNPDYASSPANSRTEKAGDPFANYAPPRQQEPLYLPQTRNPYPAAGSFAPPDSLSNGYPQQGQAAQPFAPGYMPHQRRRSSGWLVALITVLVLILIGGSALIYYVAVYQPNQGHVQATETAQSHVTGTAQAEARAVATAQAELTGTVNAQRTATMQTTATATALDTLYTQVTSGTPTLNDMLSAQSRANWDELNSTVNGTCGFTGQAYHSIMPQKGFFQPCYAQAVNFNDFAFQVQMTVLQGDEGGILFRADNQKSAFYLFRLARDGSYTLFLYVNNQGTQARSILNGNSPFIQTDLNVPNVVTVIARGSSLLFYVNKQYLGGTNDSTYASGKIGVFAESNVNATDVAFSNAKVWTL